MKKLLFQLSVPTMFSVMISTIYNLADTFFVGQIGTSASAAVGILASFMTIVQALGFTYGHGAGGIVSRSLGAKDSSAATRFTSTSFFAAIASGAVLGIIGLLFLEPMLYLLGSTDTILPFARDYGFYIICAVPIMMSSLVLNNVLRYEGKATFAMVGLVTGGILNIILDPIFIFALNMGVAGAGLATAISQLISWCILLFMFLSGKTISKISLRNVTRDKREFQKIVLTGMPSFGRQGLGSVASICLNLAAGVYGDAAIAAMSIVTRVFQFVFVLTVGIGQGFQPIAAFNYGAKRYGRVREGCLLMIQASLVLTAIASVLCFAFTAPLVQLFRDDPAVIAIAIPALRYQCIASFCIPVSTASNFLFQSIGKAKPATFLACCRQGICLLPLILILPQIFGIAGIQLAQPLADLLTFTISSLMLFPFLRHLKEQQEGLDCRAASAHDSSCSE